MSYLLNKNNSIAVFDSGVGGISVLRELVKIMPNENYTYFGDSKNAPYGTKTTEEVRELTCANAKMLFDAGCKGLVVACNTATAAAVRKLREIYPEIPIVGIEPAVKPAAHCKDHPTVLVMATPMTIREQKFQNLMKQYESEAEIIPLSCPGFMDFIERGDVHGDDLKKYLTELLFEFKDRKIDAAVLGCTHYPFATDLIREILGEDVYVIHGGPGTAKEMRRRLAEQNLLTDRTEKGTVDFQNSLDSEEKLQLCNVLLYSNS